MSVTHTFPSEAPRRRKPPGTGISILLVDDDARNLLALESILAAPEHRLVKVQTADAALLALMREDYAAIVLDVQMPEMSGIDLARLIKQRKKTQHIPIIFLTAHYRENEHAVLGYDAGAVDYLTKPVHPAVLRSKVSVFVDLFRKTQALAEMNQTMESEIAERKTAEERFRVVVEAAPNAMLVFNKEGGVVLVNSQAERLFEQTRTDLLEARIRNLLPDSALAEIPPDGGDRVAPALEEDREHAPPITIKRRDHAEVPVEINFTPIQSGDETLWLASIVDITERKRAEEALRTANAELEAKNVALERQAAERLLRLRAEAGRAEAEAANAAKDRFLAMLSHELRTPLSPVLHGIALLDEHPDCTPELRETFQVIRRNIQLEARLIDDLLDLARIRNGKLQLQLQTTDAHDVLRHAVEICEHDISTRNLKVDLRLKAGSTVVNADPARLQQIFWNVISNAVKFTPPHGSIFITSSNDENGDQLIVEVGDTGAGIDPTKLERIFDAFEQAVNQGQAGLGLGLAICKALAEFHNGHISANSAGLGKGATFTVTLPTANLLVAPVSAERVHAKALPLPLRLLVVEDHLDTAATLRRLLMRRGYSVESAASVTSALEAAKSTSFDVLVTDIGLPDGNGVELFQQLKTQELHSSLRGIALSGFGMDEDIARSKAAGFEDHLTKPVDFAHLHHRLAQIGQEMKGAISHS